MTPLDGSSAASWLAAAALALGAYLLGGIPWSLLIVRWVRGVDLREVGSGNLGATNAARTLGGWWAVAIFGLDFSKSAVPVAISGVLFSGSAREVAQIASGVASIIGHVYSPYIRFRGGKGIATTAGVAAAMTPLCLLWGTLAFFAVGIGTRRVSLGSLAIAAVYPPLVWYFYPDRPLSLAFSVGVSTLIIVAHRANIRRLIRGEEPKASWGIFK